MTRDWDAQTKRFMTDKTAQSKYDQTKEQDQLIVRRVAEIAETRQVKRAQVALAWLLQKESSRGTNHWGDKRKSFTGCFASH